MLAGGWNHWADAVAELTAALPTAERDAVLAGTASRFCQLSRPEEPA